MKHTFVLDENVVIRAFDGAETCVNIITQMDRNCHNMAVDVDLWGKYSAHMDRLKTQGQAHGLNVAKLLADIWSREPEKAEFEATPAVIEKEPEVPRKDVAVVSLAAAVQAILVTDDGGLLELNDKSVSSRLGIAIMAPEDALRRARESNHGQA